MNNLKTALAFIVLAAAFVLPGCASVEGQFDTGDILATMQQDSQSGGD
jgi:hypothetical protein